MRREENKKFYLVAPWQFCPWIQHMNNISTIKCLHALMLIKLVLLLLFCLLVRFSACLFKGGSSIFSVFEVFISFCSFTLVSFVLKSENLNFHLKNSIWSSPSEIFLHDMTGFWIMMLLYVNPTVRFIEWCRDDRFLKDNTLLLTVSIVLVHSSKSLWDF